MLREWYPKLITCLRLQLHVQVLALRAEEVRAVSRTDVRTTDRLHAAQLRAVTAELARSQEHLQQLRRAADDATAAFQDHCCQASYQVGLLLKSICCLLTGSSGGGSLLGCLLLPSRMDLKFHNYTHDLHTSPWQVFMLITVSPETSCLGITGDLNRRKASWCSR